MINILIKIIKLRFIKKRIIFSTLTFYNKFNIYMENEFNCKKESLYKKKNFLLQECSKEKKLKPKKVLLDKILEEYGYKQEIIIVIICSILLYFLSSYYIYHVSCYFLIIKNEFEISENYITVITCFGFFFKSLGCFLVGFSTHLLTRKQIILINLCILFCLNLFMTFKFALWNYIIFVLVGCFVSGNLDPINIDVLCEFLPIKFRGFFLCFTYTGFALSQLVQYFLINFYTVGNKTDIKQVLFLNNRLLSFILFFVFIFFKNSPRNYLIKQQYTDAFKILNKLTDIPLTEEEKQQIIKETDLGSDSIHEESIKEIFSENYLKTTLIFIILNFSYNSMTDGLSITLNLILEEYIPESNESKISFEGMLIYLFGLFTYFFCGILTEIDIIKRKFGLFICSSILISNSFLIHIFPSNYLMWLTLIILATNSTTSLSISFVSESYPSKIRDMSQGFMNSVANFGSLVGQLIFMALYNKGRTISVLNYTIFNSVICMFLIFLITKDMHKKPLDSIKENISLNLIQI